MMFGEARAKEHANDRTAEYAAKHDEAGRNRTDVPPIMAQLVSRGFDRRIYLAMLWMFNRQERRQMI